MAKFTQKTKAHYESIRDLEALIRKAEYIEELYKRQHAAAKRKRESLCIRLRTLIRDDQLKLPGLEDDEHQEMTITEQLKMFWESNPGLDSKE